MDPYRQNDHRNQLFRSHSRIRENDTDLGKDNLSYIEFPADIKQNNMIQENGKFHEYGNLNDPITKEEEMMRKYGRPFDRTSVTETNTVTTPAMRQRSALESISRKSAWGLQNDSEETDQKSWKNVCINFTQNTSIHGVNKVTEETPFMARRLVWFILVLLGLGGCTYQVGERSYYFLTNPVSVNVKVIYNSSLRFPAISICNQNTFRLSEAYRLGYYEVLNAMFSNKQKEFNVTENNASSLVLYDLYNKLRHTKEQFVVSCTWNNAECQEEDLMTVMTDHGSCLTFNGNRSGDVLSVSHTGADRGLRLQLNVEQYEYMSGPHDAAGLKILVHDQDEVPFVRDLGEAIPTGVTAFVGVQTQAVKNLEDPYGSCDDSKNLSHFDYYSSSACRSDCRTIHAKNICNCRDIYMPSAGVPYCNMTQYIDCIIPNIDISTKAEDECVCPVPCRAEYHKTIVTYSSSSSISTAQLLVSNLTQTLSRNFMDAREIRQRVDQYTVETDTENIRNLHEKWTTLENLLKDFKNQTQSSNIYFQDLVSELDDRLFWHRFWGIEKIKLAVDRNFARGWEVMDERTFAHVTTKFYQQSSLYKRMVQESLANPNDTNLRLVHYLTTDREFQYRAELVERALTNYTTLHEAFTNATPIYNFRLTPIRNFHSFDKEYSKNLHEFLQANTEGKYYKKILSYSLDYLEHVDKLRNAAKVLYENGTIDTNTFEWSLSRFEQRCRNFNYYRYMYRENVIFMAQATADDRVNTFKSLNETHYENIDELRLAINNIQSLLNEFEQSFVKTIADVVYQAKEYLTNRTHLKSSLASAFTSKKMVVTLSDTSVFLKDMRTRGQQADDAWQRFRVSYERLWSKIIGETSLEYVFNQTRTFIQRSFSPNETNFRNTLFPYLASMLNSDLSEVQAYSEEILMRKTNADASVLTKDMINDILNEKFARATAGKDILAQVTTASDVFASAMESMQNDMRTYLQSTVIDSDFYKENFLQLNVYMSEMNYEEIEQQVAYDVFGLIRIVTKLVIRIVGIVGMRISDIGGAMGLFIGASFLTVFEFLDIIASTFLKKYVCTSTRYKEEEKKGSKTVERR